MPTVQQILDKVDLYRNPYSASDKVDWMDTVQKQIFQDVPHEALPYSFTTLSGYSFYALPSDCDPMGPKTLTIETGVGSGRYKTLRFISNNSTERLGDKDEFYSIQGNENIFLNPEPDDTTAGRKVYLVYNKRPATLSSANTSAIPDLEEDFHELLELGVKIRIARERGEEEDQFRFQRDFDRLYQMYVRRYKFNFPKYHRTFDVMPTMRRGGRAGRHFRSYVSELIPE